jgi:lipopolysaccharide biosynthesis glycosyltransferase
VPADQRLLLTFDENYALPGLVALHTALMHTPPTVHVTVASVGLSEETIRRARRAVEGHVREFTVVEVERLVNALPTGLPRFSPAAWARIFIDRIISEETERIIYLDADTYCRRSIHELFEVDLASMALGAVLDPLEPTHEVRGADYWTAASTRPSSGYFNSGVMVIDRSSWVARDVTGEALRVISERRVPTRSVDQDVLNAVLCDQWVPLRSVWNTVGITNESLSDAAIVHFMGDHKPWLADAGGGLFAEEYRREAAGLGWSA